MHSECLLCSGDLVKHVNQFGTYWRCNQCRQQFSDEMVKWSLQPPRRPTRRFKFQPQGERQATLSPSFFRGPEAATPVNDVA